MKLLFKLLVIGSFVNGSFCDAQNNFSKSKLFILIEEPNKKIAEKLEPNELIVYQKEIENYNLFLNKYVAQCWKMEVKPEFVYKAAMDKIIEEKNSNTLILTNSKYSFNYADYSSYKLSNKLYQAKDVVVENYNKKQLPFRATILELKRADLPTTAAAVATAVMPSIKQNEAALLYAVKSLALQIDYKNKGTSEVQLMKMYIKNAPHLKELTLLVDQQDLDEAAKAAFAAHYKLPFQLVDKVAVDNALLNADQSKAVALVIPNADGSFIFKVVDAANMEILGQTATIPPSEYYPALNNKIKINHLEDFTQYCD